ncbi:MAG: HEAT repeat domain-containing protein [Sedimentisphaerales bacterium]|nr:HEAT repeat domain-containing protein [Sedimentisphaerales bacterium]
MRTINLTALLFLCFCTVCVGASEERGEAIDIVLDILKSGDQEMQAVAIAMVKDMPGTEVTKALVKELPTLSAASQVMLLSALSDRGDATALDAVVATIKTADESVRIAALKAVGQLGNESSVGLLAETAARSSGAEQKAARESLYRLRGPKVDGAILAGISEVRPKTRVELIKSVGERNISAGVSSLLTTVKDPDREVRLESLKVLKVIAAPENLPALVELLLDLKSSADLNEAGKTIAFVAHKIENKNRQAEAVLAVLPSVKDVKKQSSLLIVLGKIGDGSALPRLREALSSKNADIKKAAIHALAEWPTSEPVSDLMKTAEDSKDTIHRILALRGSVRLLGLDSKLSSRETVKFFEKAMALAPNESEKKRVLSGLANAKSLDALEMAKGFLKDKDLSREAEYTVVKICGNIRENFPQQTSDILKKIVQTTNNEVLQTQAQAIINKINESIK